jgi:hypothetical protein
MLKVTSFNGKECRTIIRKLVFEKSGWVTGFLYILKERERTSVFTVTIEHSGYKT